VTEVGEGEMWLATRVFAVPGESVKSGWLKEWEKSQTKWDTVEQMKQDLGI
jgi:hypothetical protein